MGLNHKRHAGQPSRAAARAAPHQHRLSLVQPMMPQEHINTARLARRPAQRRIPRHPRPLGQTRPRPQIRQCQNSRWNAKRPPAAAGSTPPQPPTPAATHDPQSTRTAAPTQPANKPGKDYPPPHSPPPPQAATPATAPARAMRVANSVRVKGRPGALPLDPAGASMPQTPTTWSGFKEAATRVVRSARAAPSLNPD